MWATKNYAEVTRRSEPQLEQIRCAMDRRATLTLFMNSRARFNCSQGPGCPIPPPASNPAVPPAPPVDPDCDERKEGSGAQESERGFDTRDPGILGISRLSGGRIRTGARMA